MKKKVDTDGTMMAFATYKPKPGQEKALKELVDRHLPTLRELELATDRNNYVARCSDGTIVEVFEWTSMEAVSAAHEHPAVADIWEKMTMVAEFVPMAQLPEANRPFPGFEILDQ